ncbi:MAG: 1-phosphatidylinositol 4,5-bisphosphate phosphodiesterase delta-1, partial [Paramarteilia canceri]
EISTILRISELEDSENVIKIDYIDNFKSKTLSSHVSFTNDQDCICFLKSLGYLLTKSRLSEAHERQVKYQIKVFESLDADNNGFLTLEELEKLYVKLKIPKKDELFKYLYSKIALSSENGLSAKEFITFYNTLCVLPDIELIFCTYALSYGSINVQQFVRFMKLEQKEKITSDGAVEIIKKYEVNKNAAKGLEMTLDGFINYIFSNANQWETDSFIATPHQSSEYALTDYFVKSCFIVNKPDTSILESYANAAKEGYRHFELEIYVQSKHNLILLSSRESIEPIDLAGVLNTLNTHADLTYGPLILTLHLNFDCPTGLNILTNTLIKCFEKKLCIFDETVNKMPSLLELYKKVLIRSSLSKLSEIEKNISKNGDTDNPENISFRSMVAFNEVAIDDVPNDSDDWNLTITFPKSKFASFSDIEEEKALHLTSSYFVSVSPRNTFQMVPPTTFYNFGVHSVLQPYPKNDISNTTNDAFFKLNGNCGYVLKQEAMRKYVPQIPNSTLEYNASVINTTNIQNDISINVSISIISARFIPKMSIKPFIHLELFGPVPMFGSTDVAEGFRDSYKINPRFNNQFEFELPKNAYKQTVLQVSLWDNQALLGMVDSTDQILGRCCVHLANLKQGFRNIHLTDDNGKILSPTTILIHVKKSRVKENISTQNTSNIVHNNSFSFMNSPVEKKESSRTVDNTVSDPLYHSAAL